MASFEQTPHPRPESSGVPASEWLRLEGRNIVVTGAASGIGLAIAAALAAAGSNVVMLDIDHDTVQRAASGLANHGGRVVSFACDIADRAQIQEMAARVRRDVGSVHGLVNNAGMLRSASLAVVDSAAWEQVLAVNLSGALWCAQAFGEDMRAAGEGSIVHVASISALYPQTHSGAYSASKAGLLLLSRQLAAEWGPQGVRSNAICPGMIRTALSAPFYAQPGIEARRAAATASRRIGEPDDVAAPALFLLSPRSGYINGVELLVDGGLHCMLMDMVPRPGFNDTASATQSSEIGHVHA